MKSTEQVPDAHRALPRCFTTSPRSGATSPGTGPGYNRTQAANGYMSTIRLPDAPSNVTAPVLADAAGPDIIPAGYSGRPPEKADGLLSARQN